MKFAWHLIYRAFETVIRASAKKLALIARKHYRSHLVSGMEFVGPLHYVSCISKTVNALKQRDPASFELVTSHIRVIYASQLNLPIGFVSRCAFVDSKIELLPDVVWVEFAGYLVRMAKLAELLEAGYLSVLTRWSSYRDLAYKAEDDTMAKLSRNDVT